ncbi:MAG TPA: hypothetical protein DGT21_11660 [Armatimonadetes bacterium]|jgi:hypothetical protein|nr:hypothetical protein [Armatimonadota bacterium]
MPQPIVIRKGAEEKLFDAQMLAKLEAEEIDFRDVGVNDYGLVPGGGFAPQLHDDKLEVVTPVALGKVEGPVVRYTDDEGGYEFELASLDSIVIPRGVKHAAYNICDTMVALFITNFSYRD